MPVSLAQSIRRMSRSGALVGLVSLLAPAALLAPVWRLGGLGAGEDDLLYYFPSRVFLHETVRAGEAPWLNPWIGMGRPYLADPQSALFYPTTWLFAVLDPLVAYPASLWLHYSLAIWGMFRLLRAHKLDTAAALFGGLCFAFCGFMLAHRAHFTMQHAAAWTPIVFWRVGRYASAGRPIDLAFAAGVSAAQCFAGHVQIAALTQLGVVVYLVAAAWSGTFAQGLGLTLTRWALAVLGAVGLFSVQWAPTMAYVAECTRGERGYMDFVENSWNPLSAIGWTIPTFFGQRTPNLFDQPYWGPSHQCEQFSYIGILPLLLALAAIRNGWRDDASRKPWVILLIFSLLLALGLYGPICPLLYWIPGASLFRVPARAMLLAEMSAIFLAASAVHDLAATLTPQRVRLRAKLLDWSRRPWQPALALVAAPLMMAAVISLALPGDVRSELWSAIRPWRPTVMAPLLAALLSAGVLLLVLRRWNQPAWRHALTLMTLADLGLIGWSIDAPRGPRTAAELVSSAPRQEWLSAVRAARGGRLWVVTSRDPQSGLPGEYVDSLARGVANINVLDRVASLTDYGPLQPRSLDRLLHLKPWGEAEQATHLLSENEWMDACNIEWILLCSDELIAPRGCELVMRTERGYRLYRNPSARGEVFLENAGEPAVTRFSRTSNHSFSVILDSWPAGADDERQLRLVASQLYLPGWSAKVGPYSLPVSAAGVLLSAPIPAGMALRVDFDYFPPGLAFGAIMSGLTLAGLALIALSSGLMSLLRPPKRG